MSRIKKLKMFISFVSMAMELSDHQEILQKYNYLNIGYHGNQTMATKPPDSDFTKKAYSRQNISLKQRIKLIIYAHIMLPVSDCQHQNQIYKYIIQIHVTMATKTSNQHSQKGHIQRNWHIQSKLSPSSTTEYL